MVQRSEYIVKDTKAPDEFLHRGLCLLSAVSQGDYLSLAAELPFSSIAACAAASLATGIRFGEQET